MEIDFHSSTLTLVDLQNAFTCYLNYTYLTYLNYTFADMC